MNSSSINALVRTLSYTDATNMTDATLLTFANLVYHDLENTIVSEVDEDFFYDEWTTDTVIGQREYVLPVKSGVTSGLKKLLGVSCKFLGTDSNYTKMREERLSNLPSDLRYYDSNASAVDPFFIIADKSVFLYPDPTEVIADGIRLYGVANLGDLASSYAEVDIKIPVEFHEMMVWGMLPLVHQSRGMGNESIARQNEYLSKKRDMVFNLSDRNKSPIEAQMPNLTWLD